MEEKKLITEGKLKGKYDGLSGGEGATRTRVIDIKIADLQKNNESLTTEIEMGQQALKEIKAPQ